MQVGIDVDYRKSSYLDFVIRILVIELSDDGGVVWRVIFTEITHICSHFYLEYFFGETEFHVQVAGQPERPSVLMNLKEKCDAPECNPTVCRKVRAGHEL